MAKILLDIAPLSPFEMFWYDYGTAVILLAAVLAIIAVFAIILAVRKSRK